MTIDDATTPPRHEQDRQALFARARVLQDACRCALEATVDEPTMARAAGRTLGLDKTLAWKFVRIAQADTPSEVFAVLPGPGGWNRVCDSIAAADGGGADLAAAIRKAVAALEQEASDRGVPRRRLRSLAAEVEVAAAGSNRAATEIERVRESLTRANTAIWGVGAAATIRTFVIGPAEEPERLRIATVTTFRGLHRTRPGPEWPIHRIVRVRHDDGQLETADEAARRDVDCADLCTPGALEETGVIENARTAFRTFRGDRTSPASPVDLVFAETAAETGPMFARARGEEASFGVPIWVPTGVLILEVLLDRHVPWTAPPMPQCFSDIAGMRVPAADRGLHRMPLSEELQPATELESSEDLDMPAEVRGADDTDPHAIALARTIESLGGEPADFVRHRLRIAHPALSTSAAIVWPMPAKA